MATNPKALHIVKALAYTENGGEPKQAKAGSSGEMKSIFQYMPDTWKQYSKQVFGNENTPLTPENESLVTYQKVNNWLNEGYQPEQIASMWNAGEQRPDAYKQNHKGKNTKGVMFDTPGYVKKFSNYLNEFSNNASVNTSKTKNPPVRGGMLASASTPVNTSMINSQPMQKQNSGVLTPEMKQVKQV